MIMGLDFNTAIFFITNFLLFSLGLHGITFFKWIHKVISSTNIGRFGTICTLLCAIILIYIQWKYR